MTNQECNQVYWETPTIARETLDLLLADGHRNHAAHLLRVQAESSDLRVPTEDEAAEWAEWRMSLRSMARRA